MTRGSDRYFLRQKTRPAYETGQGAPIRVVDLFAGCGGMTLGVAEACRRVGRPMTSVLAMDVDTNALDIFDANFFPEVTERRGNVNERFNGGVNSAFTAAEKKTVREVAPIDILIGGPPCQGHSDLNNHTRRDDPKNALYMKMVRAAQVLLPNHVVIENVPGVQNDRKRVLEKAVRRLQDLDYKVAHGVVDLTEIGVPQTRLRHLLLASTTHTPSLESLVNRFRVSKPRGVWWAVGDLERIKNGSGLDEPSVLSAENLKRARHLHRWGKYELTNGLRPPCHRDKPDHRYTSMYGRLSWDAPAQTITTGFSSPGQGRYLHPSQLRTITAHEAARLQFFPDWFDFTAAPFKKAIARCIGNAVPPKLAMAAAYETLFATAAPSAGSSRASARSMAGAGATF